MKKLLSIMSNFHFQNVDQHTGGKWLIHGTKHLTISCKALNSPVEYPSRESKHDIKTSVCNMFNPMFKGNVQEQKHPGSCVFAEPELLKLQKA